MSTRPTDLPYLWATDGGALITEPNAGKKADGFIVEPLACDYLNHLIKRINEWALHFADGTWTDDIAIDGDLDVTGLLTAEDVTVGGDLIAPNIEGDTSVNGVVTADNFNVGTGTYRHGSNILHLPPAAGQTDANAASWIYLPSTGSPPSAWFTQSGVGAGDAVSFPVSLVAGDRVSAVSAIVDDEGGSVSISLWRSVPLSNTNTQIGGTDASSGGGTPETISVTGLTEDVSSGRFLTVQIESDDTVLLKRIMGVFVTYSRP